MPLRPQVEGFRKAGPLAGRINLPFVYETISKDKTGGQETREASLLAQFGAKLNRRALADSASSFGGTSPSAGAGAMKRLDELCDEFSAVHYPLCKEYVISPPSDPKKRDEEHRKISETVLQYILLKLDEVDTEGVLEVSARKKDLVTMVQNILRALDSVRAS
ncbi:hypothetical protein QQS21_000773 [Conoideocrella luteorostrata]|uniref:BAG domain-containing protein n=1 Tax=Conoideocrella luteorostrata TaxID=1105319 RepID=A0AAJ0FY81_9HYPO|nr:hypothetical protein QQS21_000773 [Conoideocrella luteorostrata]